MRTSGSSFSGLSFITPFSNYTHRLRILALRLRAATRVLWLFALAGLVLPRTGTEAIGGAVILGKETPIAYSFTTISGTPTVQGTVDQAGPGLFGLPKGVAVDTAGNVYVADMSNNLIRKVNPDGSVSTLAGLAGTPGSADGTGSSARFNQPSGIALDSAGNLYVADRQNSTIRKLSPTGAVTTLAGQAGNGGSHDGPLQNAQFSKPEGIAVDAAGKVYIADTGNSTIRVIDPAGVVWTLAGLAGSPGSDDGLGSSARFYHPRGIAVDSLGDVYVTDVMNTIRRIDPMGLVTTLAGMAGVQGSADGTGNSARFKSPQGLAVDSEGNVYVADSFNETVRKVNAGGAVTTLAGLAGNSGSSNGIGSEARFSLPSGSGEHAGGVRGH